MNFILSGPQGSGKGTQAELLSEKLDLPTVSVGQLLRDEINGKTELGQEVEKYVLQGVLVPNDLTNKMVAKELAKDEYKKGVILDGYPRAIDQAEFLDKIIEIDNLIFIKISEEETVKRLGGRRVCKCGENYHIEFKKPQTENICDKCGGELIRRKDDRPEAIKERLNVYHEETEPIIEYYREKGKVIEIDGEATIDQVFERIANKLKDKGIK